jgi:hypothetical protein
VTEGRHLTRGSAVILTDSRWRFSFVAVAVFFSTAGLAGGRDG